MKLRFIVFPFILAASVALIQAKPVGQHGQLARELGLSKAQKGQMKAIRQQARTTAKPIADQLKQNHQALAAAVKAGDTSQIESLSKTQGALKGQALAIHSEATAKIYAGLTPDQRTKMDQLESQRKQAKPTKN